MRIWAIVGISFAVLVGLVVELNFQLEQSNKAFWDARAATATFRQELNDLGYSIGCDVRDVRVVDEKQLHDVYARLFKCLHDQIQHGRPRP